MVKRKKWLLIIIALLVLIQFIRPARNYKSVVAGNTLDKITPVPDSVHELLKHACFDCHSNNTVYPWYANVQPVGWWLANHIKEGKEELNFDDMPGKSYLTIYKNRHWASPPFVIDRYFDDFEEKKAYL